MNPNTKAGWKKLLEELCKLYQDYLAESEVYDGASFWGNKRVEEIQKDLILTIRNQIMEESNKMERQNE